ncbi:hypothetical protein Smp_058020 [Schistosoma mansoni]|uniref:hypothetical protein n=1 Tax=Schistosoma mansoni TaxID=6183 RepID=UPI0001A6396E|nr:hypothetical protein Smp_058020 [Schistosoma mansoni]|eukprot:XP_018652640.1 hypothetical protein Smp_058020 [Schistosoma mansoni]
MSDQSSFTSHLRRKMQVEKAALWSRRRECHVKRVNASTRAAGFRIKLHIYIKRMKYEKDLLPRFTLRIPNEILIVSNQSEIAFIHYIISMVGDHQFWITWVIHARATYQVNVEIPS